MVTMEDVAKMAGVSRATASYALRGDARIAPDTAKKVLATAKKLHYSPSFTARALSSGRSRTIGVALFEFDRPFPAELSAAIALEANRRGYRIIAQQMKSIYEDEKTVLTEVIGQICDGTIFSPTSTRSREIRDLADGRPVVLLDDPFSEHLLDTINTPGERGAYLAVNHLVDIGCRNILVLGADHAVSAPAVQDDNSGGRRLRGCRKAFNEINERVRVRSTFFPAAWGTEDAYLALKRLLQEGYTFDGVFCLTDSMALGVLRALADNGIRVPQQVAVIGFDGIAEGRFCVPTLSTIEVDREEIASKAVDLVVRRIESREQEFRPVVMEVGCRLVVRQSTAKKSMIQINDGYR